MIHCKSLAKFVAPALAVTLSVTHLQASTVVVFGTLVRLVYQVHKSIAVVNRFTALVFNQSLADQLDLYILIAQAAQLQAAAFHTAKATLLIVIVAQVSL